jgi:N-methylhydantoinase A/oxoprolinase/acetone carboxylase beta subunit
LQIGVDIGGTFTDIVALDGEGRLVLTKVPSTPKDLLEGIDAAVRRVLTLAGAPASAVERFIHGTTVATNAVLEQKGAVTAILTTEGFEDVLEMGRQKRSRMYDLDMDPETPTFVAPRRRRIGIRERLDATGILDHRNLRSGMVDRDTARIVIGDKHILGRNVCGDVDGARR